MKAIIQSKMIQFIRCALELIPNKWKLYTLSRLTRKTCIQYLALFMDNDKAVSEDYPQYKENKFDLYEVFDGNPLHMPSSKQVLNKKLISLTFKWIWS